MTTELRAALEAPFGKQYIKERPGTGGSRLSYIDGGDIIQRVNQATGGNFTWWISNCDLIFDGDKPSFWLCRGTISIPGLGERAGVGTHPFYESPNKPTPNVEAPKTAETDAFKRAARLFGVALQLWCEDAGIAQDAKMPDPAPQRHGGARKEVETANTGGAGIPATEARIKELQNACIQALKRLGRPDGKESDMPKKWKIGRWALVASDRRPQGLDDWVAIANQIEEYVELFEGQYQTQGEFCMAVAMVTDIKIDCVADMGDNNLRAWFGYMETGIKPAMWEDVAA